MYLPTVADARDAMRSGLRHSEPNGAHEAYHFVEGDIL